MFLLDSDPAVMRYITGGKPTPRATLKEKIEKTIESYKKENGLGLWLTVLKENDELIGWHFIKPFIEAPHIELGYRLYQKAWGKGYATEMANGLANYGFQELNLPKLVAITDKENIGSQNVLSKVGFQLLSKQAAYHGFDDLYYYELENPNSRT